jgi:hypothetical protein
MGALLGYFTIDEVGLAWGFLLLVLLSARMGRWDKRAAGAGDE